jgi:uncharacterized membrane protein
MSYFAQTAIGRYLPPLPGATSSNATAINKHGYVVGTASVSGHSHGFFWGNGVTRDSGVDIQSNDINATNEIVGNRTTGNLANFVHIAGVTYDLVTLISPTDLLQPYVTFADPYLRINDNGVIAVAGVDSPNWPQSRVPFETNVILADLLGPACPRHPVLAFAQHWMDTSVAASLRFACAGPHT